MPAATLRAFEATQQPALLFSVRSPMRASGQFNHIATMHKLAADNTSLTLPDAFTDRLDNLQTHQPGTDKRSRRVLMIGYGRTAQTLHRRVREQRRFAYQIVAVHDPEDNPLIGSDVEQVRDAERIGEVIRRQHIHEVWITLPAHELSRWSALQPLLCQLLIDLRWAPDTDTMSILSHRPRDVLGMPMIDLNHPPGGGLRRVTKHVFDRGFALIVLILLLPLLLLLAAAIKCTSPGPVFFKQPRLGLNGKRFNIYKFRSMKLHQETDGTLTQATRDDPRVTRIGRFMRRTSLDELPQFINVLKGDMSIVGPRPHALVHNDLYKNKLLMYMQRHRVKPGITGWAQINGCRGETDTQEKMARRVALDLHYIRHWSFRMDLKIILWTAFKGWTDHNAY